MREVPRVKISVPVTSLARLLGLPDDVRIVGLYATPDPMHLFVLLEGDGLPDVPVSDWCHAADQESYIVPWRWTGPVPAIELGQYDDTKHTFTFRDTTLDADKLRDIES